MLDHALGGISTTIRKKLITSYLDLKRGIAEGRYESAGVSAGKFCEAAIRHLQKVAFGQNVAFGKKIPNFADECRKVITSSANTLADSEKRVIPRALVFLYTMRNTRGIGHVGGDVDANGIDLAAMGSVADWVVCELIRIHHGLSLEEAQDLVDGLAVRRLPDVWDVGDKKRILREGLASKDQALLLLYSVEESAVLTEDLVAWIEYSNASVFKSRILKPLHKSRFVEWDTDSETVTLSPKGARYVEDKLLRS